jgi:hypothetical protein
MIDAETFRSFLAEFNRGVFPTHILWYGLGVGASFLVLARPGKWADVAAKGVLALLWAWLGLVYMIVYYTRINSAGYVWGALFLLQAVFFAVEIFWPKIQFSPTARPRLGHLAAAVAGWAFVGYPITALIFGHGWPELALFGCATPVALYTCGMLLFTFDRRPRWRFLFIPFLWSVVGGLGPAAQWQYYEDYALFGAGIILLIVWFSASQKYKKKKKS